VIKNLLLIILLFVGSLPGFSQNKPLVLLSDSLSVAIKIDGNRVATWYIDADTKPWTEPDVFTIDRSFENRKVTYQSDHDSLSFTAIPGGKYDFTILIKNHGAYPMRLATFDEPVFQHRTILICIFLGIIVIICLGYLKRNSLETIPLLYLGVVTPILFWAVLITGGFIHRNYNHLHKVVSELGAIGTRSEVFMSTTVLLISILSVFSIVGMYKACRQIGLNVIPVLTMLSLSISMVWAAIFPMHHELHGELGPIPLSLNIGVLLAVLIWKGKEFASLRLVSLVSFILMSLILLRIVPSLRGNWEGLIQRFFYLGWSAWSIAISLIFIRLLESKNNFIPKSI
jgi:Protein of unknown function (DUF998)